MKERSYLISEYDPFIVLPINMLVDKTDPFAPKIGDYALVIHNKEIFPCIVGSGGKNFKAGEASLRLRRELDPGADSNSAALSGLAVSYVVFLGSLDQKANPPDYARINQRCIELVQEIGGFGNGYIYHRWKDLLAKETE